MSSDPVREIAEEGSRINWRVVIGEWLIFMTGMVAHSLATKSRWAYCVSVMCAGLALSAWLIRRALDAERERKAGGE